MKKNSSLEDSFSFSTFFTHPQQSTVNYRKILLKSTFFTIVLSELRNPSKPFESVRSTRKNILKYSWECSRRKWNGMEERRKEKEDSILFEKHNNHNESPSIFFWMWWRNLTTFFCLSFALFLIWEFSKKIC